MKNLSKFQIQQVKNISIFSSTVSGFQKKQVESIVEKKMNRLKSKVALSRVTDNISKLSELKSLLKTIKECEYNSNCTSSRYNSTGIDWVQYVRYSSHGGIYFCSPDEPSNCYCVEPTYQYFYLLKKSLDKKILKNVE